MKVYHIQLFIDNRYRSS